MKQFVVVHHLVTPMMLSDLSSQQTGAARWKFDLPNDGRQVIIQEFVAPYYGIQRTSGLDVYTRLQAADEATALTDAADTIATIYGLMCLQGRTFIEKTVNLSTLEIIDGKDDLLSYALYDEPSAIRTGRRVLLTQATFSILWQADLGLVATDKAKRRQLHIAMGMLRNGTAITGQISKFFHYWIGIASLDHHLNEVEAANGSRGWRDIFTRHGLDFDQFSKARNQLQHPSSSKNFTRSYAFALESMNKLEPVLTETILRLYGINDPTLSAVMGQKPLGPNEMWSVVRGEVEGVPPSFDDVPTSFAHFTLPPIERHAAVGAANTVEMTYTTTPTADFGAGVKARLMSLERWALDLSGITPVGEVTVVYNVQDPPADEDDQQSDPEAD